MGTASTPTPALLERDADLEALATARRAASTGQGRFVIVEGGAGMGKSALLTATRTAAIDEGFEVLTAQASELERQYAFGVVRQLFEARTRRAPNWLEGAAASAAHAFDPAESAGGAVGFNDVSLAVLHGLYWLTVNACAETPMMLTVDDLHWCDQASLRFLAYIGRRLEGMSLIVVVGLRSGEPSRQDPVLADIARQSDGIVIAPAPLSEPAVAQLLEERLGAPPHARFTAACCRATGGNPLFLDELARAMQADRVRPDTANPDVVADLGPRAVSRTVFMRLARLEDDAVALARAVAVLGEGGDLGVLSAMTDLTPAAIEPAARALVRAEILRPEPPLGFLHPLIRDAVYHELSSLEREARHAQAAQLLRAAGRPAESVAAHAIALPPSGQGWVVESLHDAARVAAQRGAVVSAVSYLRRAIDEPPEPDQHAQILLELGMAEVMAIDPAPATEHLWAAYATLEHDPLMRARIAEILSRMLLVTGPPDEAIAVARQARHDLPAEMGDARRALAAVELFAANFGGPDLDTRQRLVHALQTADGDGPGTRMIKAVLAWDLAVAGGSAVECIDLATAALADGTLMAKDAGFTSVVAASVLALADRDEVLDLWEAALRVGHHRGFQLTVATVHVWRGWTWLRRGDLADADDALRQYVMASEHRAGGEIAGRAYGMAYLTRVRLEQGDHAGAREALAQSGDPTPCSDGDIQRRRAAIELLLAEQSWATALDALDVYRGRLRRVVNPAWAPYGSLRARALCGLGRTDEAVAAAADEVDAARRWGVPGTVGASLRALGTALDADGSPECLTVLDEAAATTAQSSARLEHAKSLVALGSARRRRGRPADAREPLARAVELATVCGASPLAAQALDELRAAGGRRTARSAFGPDALTPSERRVAVLAAAGHTNKAIAQQLYVTPKTVEVHLSSAYRKLGIASRSELEGCGL
ncbi:MAG TPA: AAA family ATPase [Acidimicrobiales bacterium]